MKPRHIIFYSMEAQTRINSCPKGKPRIFKVRRAEKPAHLALQIWGSEVRFPEPTQEAVAGQTHSPTDRRRGQEDCWNCWPASLACLVKFRTKERACLKQKVVSD